MALNDINYIAQADIFVYALPFLLTFAIVFGLLAQADIPKGNKKIRGMIAAISAALVLPLAPKLSVFLSTLTSSFLIVIGGLLILVILFETLGIKQRVVTGRDDKGNP